MKKNCLVGGCGFFVSDVICEVVLAIVAHVTWPRAYLLVFHWSFHWKLG